ncbi:MAG: glycosyl transferase group 1 [uncultured bacterium (gcode 4)]|uniref:Glycosyl transferase group 1 n=1 Tax=uncultured bacterium (gcode 4) TaxID=1234023 RepID=K1Z4C0_9BACT|nr:MAG: glycosyl transferase group 1 [uncultured bacterium (gcode 4)]
MQKIKVLKFLPYFPPHKGWLEIHIQEWSKWWVRSGYGEILNITFSVWQPDGIFEYSENGYRVIVLPAFELVSNFPFPAFWTRDFWRGMNEAKKFNADIINTHTRFFLSSLIGWIFAKIYRISWIHIEHGSDYVRLDSPFKTWIAWVFDQIIGRWIFSYADAVIPISEACKRFVGRFVTREMSVFYRWLDVVETGINKSLSDIKDKFSWKILVWFIGRLYKWKNVESFIRAYYELDDDTKEKIQPVVVGYGEDLERLKILDRENRFYFTGWKDSSIDIATQSQFDIHIHSSSPGGGLATTLLQAMYLGCLIIATPYEGADEAISNNTNGILLKDDSVEEIKRWILLGIENLDKRQKWSEINAQIIQEKFNWERNIKNYHNLFTQFLQTWKKL